MNTIDSVWKKVDKRGPDECWPWIGGWSSSDGYGRMDVQNVAGVYSNRIAYLATHPGSITLKVTDRTAHVLHTCDNPPCCNPAHLYLGTHDDNMKDKSVRGRGPDFRGSRGPRSKLSDEQVNEIRKYLSFNLSAYDLAKAYQVSRPTIQSIRIGRHYSG